MSAVSRAEALFLDHLPDIDRIASTLCRRKGMAEPDVEDFVAQVRARFVTTEYAPIASHRGEASLTTYLTVVITGWHKDLIVARDGRWRPSTVALRAGPMAVALERLIHLKGASADEAIAELLSGNDHDYNESDLRRIVRQLPARERLRPRLVAADDVDLVATSPQMRADARVDHAEAEVAYHQAQCALTDALSSLPPEDRTLVTMRFLDGQSVADIARALRTQQRPLYRRIERSLTFLRRRLEADGMTGASIHGLASGRDDG